MMEMCLHILYTFWHIAASELAFWHSVWPCNTVSLYHCCKKWQSLLIHWLNPLIPANLVNQTFLHRAILLLSWAPDGSLCSQDLFIKLSMSCISYSMLHLTDQLIHYQHISSQLLSCAKLLNWVICACNENQDLLYMSMHTALRFLYSWTSVYLLNKYTRDSYLLWE